MSRRKKVRARVPVRIFRCSACGALNPAPKKHGRTVAGHIKTFWCYRCQAVTDQEQVETR